MNDEVAELRARIAELERRVAVLFQQTASTDWEAEAATAPEVSEEVRLMIAAGETRKAAKRYMEETGADMGQAAAALGEVARHVRGE